MRGPLVAALALAGAALAGAPAQAQRGPRPGEGPAARHGWVLSLGEGQRQARATGKPLMVVLRCVP
jgi:hypothetical protein